MILIGNPVAKRASEHKIKHAAELVRSTGHEVEVFLTDKRGDAETLARKSAQEGASLIIAAGGDGTFNEVINGIAGTETSMAILPLGTTNVLAKELGVPENVKGAIDVALSGNVHTVSLGKITIARHPELVEESLVTRHFCLMAGIGFDGEAVYGMDKAVKKYSGKGAYILSGLKTLVAYNPEELILDVDGKTYSGYSAIIGKAARYGGNFKVTPDASLLTPSFYVCIMHGKKRSDILRYVYGIFTGRHLGFKDITYLKAEIVKVKGNAHIQLDGDYFGKTPAVVKIAPDALRLVY